MTRKQKNNIIKWVKALRSGDFKQIQNSLKFQEGGKTRYCCLGVACKINNIEEDSDSFIFEDGPRRFMPNELWFKKTFEFDSTHNFNWRPEINSSLQQLNDNSHLSFLKIAEIIEKEFLL